MAEQDAKGAQGAKGAEGAEGGAPDYKALYEESQAALGEAKAHSKKWEARSKANADKAKAYDEAQGKARTAEERLADIEAKYDALVAERAHAELVAGVARATGLDASLVSMLSGADEEGLTEQARALSEAIRAAPRYPEVPDDGAHAPAGGMTRDEVEKIKNPRERVRARAELHARERRR